MIEYNEEEVARYRWSGFKRFVNAIVIWFSLLFVDFFFKVLNRTRVIGAEHLPKGGGVLVAANHAGWADTLIIPMYSITRWDLMPFLAPAKEELFRIPVVNKIIAAWGAFPVKRRARDTESMKRIAFTVKNYRAMIFPEGTRSRTGELLRGRAGVGWIVYTARPTVVPALVVNTDQFHTSWWRRWFFAPYWVIFGKPLDLTSYFDAQDTKENSQAIADAIMRAIADLRVEYAHLFIEPPKLTGYYYEDQEGEGTSGG